MSDIKTLYIQISSRIWDKWSISPIEPDQGINLIILGPSILVTETGNFFHIDIKVLNLGFVGFKFGNSLSLTR